MVVIFDGARVGGVLHPLVEIVAEPLLLRGILGLAGQVVDCLQERFALGDQAAGLLLVDALVVEGGGFLRCDVTTDAFEALLAAFGLEQRGAIELAVDGDQAMVDLGRVVYVRKLRTGRAISFAE